MCPLKLFLPTPLLARFWRRRSTITNRLMINYPKRSVVWVTYHGRFILENRWQWAHGDIVRLPWVALVHLFGTSINPIYLENISQCRQF